MTNDLAPAPRADAAARGVSEIRHLEEQLALGTQIFQCSSEAMVVVDESNNILSVNPAFTQITGFCAGEAVGSSINMLRSELEGQAFYRSMWREINASGQWQGEVRQLRKNGQTHTDWLTVNTLPGGPGRALRRVILFSDIGRIQQAQQETRELLRQNRLLTASMLNTLEMERRHISRELHDELGQWLTAIAAEAEAIIAAEGDTRARKNAQAISDTVVRMHESIRKIVRRLRPSLLDALGLADSLGEMVGDWQARHPATRCELLLEGDLAGFGEALNICIYRVVQEALSNVAKHARAGSVRVRVARAQGEIFLSVADDGAGMDLNAAPAGVGLMGMRERVVANGGRFVVKSGDSGGVSVVVGLPVR
jgi:PAS domain S-box-containing protein